MGRIQVSFSFSLAVWKISLLSETLLHIWVTKPDLAVLQGCGYSLWILQTYSSCALYREIALCVGWAERVKKPLIFCVIFYSVFHFLCTAKYLFFFPLLMS